jgi:predicted metal-dependent TIM-barrel fold hydrolase
MRIIDAHLHVDKMRGKDVETLSVPRAVLSMRRLGLRREAIENGTQENPKRFFNLPID